MQLGRNDICRCGSGRKYKKCCLGYQSGVAQAPTLPTLPSPGVVPGIPLDDRTLGAFEHKDVVFVNGRGWTHERDLKPGDQYRLKAGGWETVTPERVIGTTYEHPFYVQDQGWTPAGRLQPGEMIRTEDGWVPVKAVEDTGRYETVYNLEVEEHHTYFVGAPEWGFSIWAHNVDCGHIAGMTPQLANYIGQRMAMFARGQGDCNRHAAAITKALNRNGIPAVTRSPTGPGQHALTLIPSQRLIVDVTAWQFAGRATATIRNTFYRELMQTGVWTRREYNTFLRSIWPHGGI